MDTTLQYVPILIVGFAASLGLTPVSRQIAMYLGVVDKPVLARKIHKDNKPMMGGLAIYVAFVVSLLLFSPAQHLPEIIAICVGGGLLAIVGLLDDRFGLGVAVRFSLMIVAALILIMAGIQIRLFGTALIDVPLTIFWVVALTNALNFLDNMDGLSAGLTTISAGFFLMIALLQGQIVGALLAAALFGSAIGFLVYNFNPASTFMGDMGALVLGFVLSALAIILKFDTQPLNVTWMVPILALAIPVFDISLVVMTRLAEGRKPWEGSKDHISHRIMALGFNQRQTLATIYVLSVIFGCNAVIVSVAPPDIALRLGLFSLSVLGVMALMMVWIRYRYQPDQRPQKQTKQTTAS